MTGLTATQPEQLPPPPHRISGKERDTESGNDYFGARYYASTMGRFMSPDPKMASSHAENPQTWNRYSYDLNRPLAMIDPDGKEAILFYRAPDPAQSSTADYGHVILYVRNDKTGRTGFWDFYPDGAKSAIHRQVDLQRLQNHSGIVIPSTPEAEDRMLNKMDEMTAQKTPFTADKSGLWGILTGTANDCVTTSERILAAGGVDDSSVTPTGLWDDLYLQFVSDSTVDSDAGSNSMSSPTPGKLYGANSNDGNPSGSAQLVNDGGRQRAVSCTTYKDGYTQCN